MHRHLLIGFLLLLVTACTFQKPPDPVVRRPGTSPLPASVASAPIRVEGVPSVELRGFQYSVERVYGSAEGLARAYTGGLAARLAEGDGGRTGAPFTLRVLRLMVDETSFSSSMWTGSIYCFLESELELCDASGTVVWTGRLIVRAADADFPSWHPYRARLKHAVADAQAETAHWLRGKVVFP